MVKNIPLKVSNLSCKHCMEAVNNTVKGLPGIISISIQTGADPSEVNISYESKSVSFEKIRGSIVELGYPVNGYIIHEHDHSHGKVVPTIRTGMRIKTKNIAIRMIHKGQTHF